MIDDSIYNNIVTNYDTSDDAENNDEGTRFLCHLLYSLMYITT